MQSEDTEHRKLAAIMFTDMVGYSALSQKDEALSLELLAEQERLLRPLIAKFQGLVIKTMGDGFLVEFASALAAVRCAVEIQEALALRNGVAPGGKTFQIRIGIHVGDVVRRDHDVFGDGVNIAARIEPLAEPGGICISEDVARQIQNKIGQTLVRIGPGELKNIQLPVVIYKLMPSLGLTALAASRLPPAAISKGRTRWLAILGAALLVLLGLGYYLWSGTSAKTKTERTRLMSEPGSIAVLPFMNMSSEKENEFLGDGIAEELIDGLVKKGLKVPSRTSAFAYKGKNEDIQKIGEQLRVRTVLQGSVRKSGTKLRIGVQLVNVADGFNLWAETYERESGDVLAIQSEIAQNVEKALRDQIGGGEVWGGISVLREHITQR
ncbi:MAG: adenylate/guanylate cyclase domain-containing protein [Verrucomicrobiota bacterium]